MTINRPHISTRTSPFKYDKAIRYVKLAEWVEASQEATGYYDVTLNCGHAMACSPAFLSASMLCLNCLEEERKA